MPIAVLSGRGNGPGSYASTCVDEWNAKAPTTTAGALVVPTVGQQIALGNGAILTFVAVNGRIIGGR